MRFHSRKITSLAFTTIVIFLAFPAIAILASWNSLPGSKLYPVKRRLETIALTIIPDSLLEIHFRFKLLDRRTKEANIALIQQASNQPLANIVAEAKSTQVALDNLNPQSRRLATSELITKLTQTNQKLEVIQTALSPTPPPTQPNPTPDPTPSPQPDNDLEENIDETQEEIEDIIDELEEEISGTISEDSSQLENDPEEDQEDEKDKGKHKGEDKGKGENKDKGKGKDKSD